MKHDANRKTSSCIECKSEATYHAGTPFCKDCAAEFWAKGNTEDNAVDNEEDTQ